MFQNQEHSHKHSLETLNTLYEYDDFMSSIGTLVDLGCGSGLDLEWWATRTTRDDIPEPLNIKCTGIDQADALPMAHKYPNITYQKTDFEDTINPPKEKFDVLWSHDSFQFAINPIQTLSNWWHIASPGAMLILILPQTTNIYRRQMVFSQPNGCYYHHTIVSLMHQLAVSGWDCKSGFFKKQATDTWLQAIVYKSDHAPMNPKTTDWYALAEKDLLPETAQISVGMHGHVQQQDLVLPWIDKSLSRMNKQ
jgi:SAM-dependent methyltransferase